ncbi:sulfate ABC transporter ATP-binding protein [bacterium]|nr:sulfate ABC transporter ATP-binding protein [bacterium]
MGIQVQNVKKSYRDFHALRGVDLEIASGELVALLGPSGSGKTTLLRIIAGLDQADSGTVIIDGVNAGTVEARKRNVGFVFQHYALFKHMTVFENVAFGLRVRPQETRPSDAAIHARVMELLKLVHLESFFDRYPAQLSGGQRQRVALARALAVEPKVLLLDEPFGALDAKVRKELRRWMRRLHDEIHITSVFVTHDQEEAMEVADRVVVMGQGRIEQVGSPGEVYGKPANAFVYDFLGNYNEFEGWKDEKGALHLTEYDMHKIEERPEETPAGLLARYPEIGSIVRRIMPARQPEFPPVGPQVTFKRRPMRGKGTPVTLFARPHEMEVTKTPEAGQEYIAARIIHLNPAGPMVKIELERKNGNLLQAEIPQSEAETLSPEKGEEVLVRPKTMKVFG